MSLKRRASSPKSTLGISSVITIAILATLSVLLYTNRFIAKDITMTSSEYSENPEIPLKITLTHVSSSKSESISPKVTLKVTIANTSPDKTVSFLRWSTPLDTKAVPMGIFVFTSVSDGRDAECLNLKLKRMLPPSGIFSAEDTIRIQAGGKAETNVEVKAPEVVLEEKKRYAVRAKGYWMHVRISDDTELRTDEDGVMRGDFLSEAVEVDV